MIAGGLLALLVGTAFTVVLVAIAELRRSAVRARNSESVLAAANRLERLVIDLETGQRGFVITGDERFLEPWDAARRSFPPQAGVLERLTAGGNAVQCHRAQGITDAGRAYIREYSEPTVDQARRDRASVLTVAVTEEGKRRVDALRAQFDGFGASEDGLASTRQQHARSAAGRATFATTVGVAGSIGLVVLFTGYLTRTIARPVRRAAAMAGRLAGGDLTVRLPETGADEIGVLERAFNTMGASLETSHNELCLLVEEQAALRRVATLVARAVPPAEVFDAVCGEVGWLLEAPLTRLLRCEPDGTTTILAGRGELPELGRRFVGERLELDENGAVAAVLRTGRAARLDDVQRALGPAALARQPGLRSAVAGPIVVQGRLWGVMTAGWLGPGPLPAGAEGRLAQFTELAATAIANADSRVELAASRARVVAAADESRRRIERDLHDGTQQRLVALALDLRAADASVPPEMVEVKAQLASTADGLAAAVDNLQEISRGIHPAILSQGGMEAALKVLARRSSVPVQLDVSGDRRLPDSVQVAVYYVVSEALTNVAKHARASLVRVRLAAEGAVLRLSVDDDGVGGAVPGEGSGLIGLRDRIEALGGTIEIASPAGTGTTLLVEIPVAP